MNVQNRAIASEMIELPFQDHYIHYHIFNELSLPEDLIKNCTVASWGSPMNSFFKTIFWVQLYWLMRLSLPANILSPTGPGQWMCRAFSSVIDEQPFQDHLLSKTIIQTWSALSPGKPEELLCLPICWFIYFLGQDDSMRCNMTSLVMWYHWHWHWHHVNATNHCMP